MVMTAGDDEVSYLLVFDLDYFNPIKDYFVEG